VLAEVLVTFAKSLIHARTIGLNDQKCQEEDSHMMKSNAHCWCKCAKHPLLAQMCKSANKGVAENFASTDASQA